MFILGRIMFLLHPEQEKGGGDPIPAPTPAPTPKDPKPEDKSVVELTKALEEARKNSVPKEQYEKLKKEKEDIVASIINGDGKVGNGQQTPPEEVDVSALREDLYGPKSSELSNLEYCQKTLQLRKAVIEKNGYDPFLPHGANIKPTSEDIEKADNVAKVMQECIDEAEGDSGVFTALLQSKTNNDSQPFLAHLKKIGALK